MKEIHFTNHVDDSTFNIKEQAIVTYTNPIHFWRDVVMHVDISLMRKVLNGNKVLQISESKKEELLKKIAFKNWLKEYQKIVDTPIQRNLLRLLETDKKSEQENLLNGLSLDYYSLMSLYFTAWNDYGYTFSNYTTMHIKGVDANKLPAFAHIEENGKLTILGNTKAGNKEIIHAIKNQHRVVIRFLDKGDTWHCFFQTMKGISGKETGQSSHLHYISNSWNIPREKVLNELLKERYKLPRLPHINFIK